MKLIICGAGQVGWQIAKHLSSENNDTKSIRQIAGDGQKLYRERI